MINYRQDFNCASTSLKYNPFSFPVIGLNGGVLLSHQMISTLPQFLKEFFKTRLTITGKIFSFKCDLTSENITPISDDQDWYSIRGESYFYLNMKFSADPSVVSRQQSLINNLSQDLELLNQWDNSPSLGIETKWRSYAAIWSTITNDLVAIEYLTRVLEKYLPTIYKENRFQPLRQQIFEVFVNYYRHLIGFEDVHSFQDSLIDLLKKSLEVSQLDLNQLAPEIDPIRTGRETDMSYFTVDGVRQFIEEFESQDIDVIVPIFGAYDLGPALKAYGFKGNIFFVIPKYKLTSSVKLTGEAASRQASQIQDILPQLPPVAGKRDIVIFDDTVASGETIDNLYQTLDARGYKITALRTLLVSTNIASSVNINQKYSQILKSYFYLPFIPMDKSGQKDFFMTKMYVDFWKQSPTLKDEQKLLKVVTGELIHQKNK